MRSPFYHFRKHQKLLLAVFGVALMIVFTVGSIILQYLDTSGQGAVDDTKVVTFKDGGFNEIELDNLRYQHNLVMAYLQTVMNQSQSLGGRTGAGMIRPGDSDRDLLQTHLLARQAREMGIVITDEAIIGFLETLTDKKIPTPQFGVILQERLKDRMTEEMLFDFLREELAAKSVEELVLSGFVAQAPDRPMEFAMEPSSTWDSFARLNRQLTAEFAAVPVDDFVGEVPEPSSAQIAEFFEKYKGRFPFPDSPEPGFKQRPEIALAYVQADYKKFLEEEKTKVTDAQVQAYYDKNKEDFRKPELPPEKNEGGGAGAASGAGGQDGEGAEVAPTPPSDSEESGSAGAAPEGQPAGNADPKRESDQSPTPGNEGQPAAPAEGNAEGTPSGEPADKPDSTNDGGQTPMPAAENGAPQPAAEPAAPVTPDGGGTAEPPGTGPENEAAEKTAEPKSNEGASYGAPESVDGSLFVALDPSAEEPAAATNDANPSGSEAPPAAEVAPAEQPANAADAAGNAGDAKPESPGPVTEAAGGEAATGTPAAGTPEKTDTPAETKPAADSGKPAAADSPAGDSQPTEPAPAETPAPPDSESATKPAEGAAAGSSEPPKQPEYRSLEEVRDQILRRLAGPPAQERLDAGLDAVRSVMDDYYQKRAKWEALRTEEPDSPQPQLPNIRGLAEKHGLILGSTPGQVDVLEFAQEEVGKASDTTFRFERSPNGTMMPQTQTTTLSGEAFTEGLPLYRAKRFPSKSRGDDNLFGGGSDIQYVFWKTAETAERVPKLADVRDNVVRTWKLREAVKLARQAAEKKAQQARQTGVTLVSEFGKEQVVEADAFTFFDQASVYAAREGQGRMMVSQIPGVEGTGEEFMEAVFDLSAGDVGVALNQPQTKYFVVRIKTDRPNLEELRERFLTRLTFGAQAGLPEEVKLLALTSLLDFRRVWLDDFEKEMKVEWKREPRPGTRQEI